jgi:Domain of unknown function (DUF4105)
MLRRFYLPIACFAALVASGCASVQPQGPHPSGVAPAQFLGNLDLGSMVDLSQATPPKLELPDWELPQLDPSKFSADKRTPSNDRDWVPEHRVLAHADFRGNQVHVHNVRNCEFYSYRDCLVDYYDKTYDLKKLQTVDFIMVPFNENRAIAHTLLSFGFEGGDYVGVSVEVRLEKGESYDPAIGLLSQFELIYVVADERDLIRVRTEYRNVDVLVYRTTATPEMARKLFVDVMKRVNQLYDQPEFYDTFSNNCTTNIVRHINTFAPKSVPTDYRVLLPGYADSLAYELGLIDNSVPFAEARRRARINDRALRYKDDPHFSQRIRGEKIR